MSESSLARLAARAVASPNLLAYALASYQRANDMDLEELARYLQCQPADLARLALCRMPRPAPHFRPDVELIAHYAGTNPIQLMKLLRSAAVRAALAEADDPARQILMAARDHDEDETPDS